MPKTIRVTFKENELENGLYDGIMQECKLIGQSAWMKQAAVEKLARGEGQKISSIETPRMTQSINSMDDLFK